MEIRRDIRDGEASIALAGRLDAAWSDSVGRALDEAIRAGAHVVRLDMGEVVFLSSAGLRVLLTAHRQLARIGGRLAVVNPSAAVRSVLEMSGLDALLGDAADADAPAATPTGPASSVAAEPVARDFVRAGARIEVRTIDAAARIRARAIGDPAAVLEGRAPAAAARVAFPRDTIGVGIGGLGADVAEASGQAGEFLAAGGAAICLAGAPDAVPDWIVSEGRLVPEVHVLHALVGEGGFAHEVRFEATDSEAGALSLADLAGLLLDETGASAAGFVLLAEVEQLVGAALRRSPLAPPIGGSILALPGVRDRITFTAEPAFAHETALCVGIVVRSAPPSLAPLLRPMREDGSLLGHVHAAAFPYRPVRKGRLALDAALSALFEDKAARGLLHLLNDWREQVGAGDSAFTRGIAWVAPLEAP